MLNINDMERRHQFRFMTDKVPDKKIIDKIVKDALKLTPIKNNTWFFYVDIYGPEYAEDKRKLCLQTACAIPEIQEDYIHQQYSIGMPREKLIQEDLFPILDEYYETGKRGLGMPAFNTQVRAPYLFVFRVKRSHYALRTMMVKMIAKNENETYAEGEDVRPVSSAWPGASMFAYVMSVLANKEGLDASFCQCHFPNNYNYNVIYNEEIDDPLFFLSIGYGDTTKNNNRQNSLRPNQGNVIKWM